MTTGRVLWLIWCLMWAGFWALAALATFGLTLIPAGLSIAAFWLPVGRPPRPQLPQLPPWQPLPGSAWQYPPPPPFRPCCGTPWNAGHRGTCEHSVMHSGGFRPGPGEPPRMLPPPPPPYADWR